MAREGEKAARAAEKAAEEAALKEKQRLLEEEQKRRKEEERTRREAARKAAEEEKQRREEEKRKRIAEEKEREAERERKRREREERQKAERREKEERERKVKEEREAKAAAERVKREQQEKEDREKRIAKEKEDKEREAKEKEKGRQAAQQRSQSVAKSRPTPTSPRNNSIASATSTTPILGTVKKLAKQQSAPSYGAVPVRQQTSRQSITALSPAQAPAPVSVPAPAAEPVAVPSTAHPITPITPQLPQAQATPQQHTSPTTQSPSTPLYSSPNPNPGLPTPAVSPRANFVPGPPVQPFASYNGIHHVPTSIVPMGIPPPIQRPFGVPQPTPFDGGFGRGLAPAAQIGPPKVTLPSSLVTPAAGMLPQVAPMAVRRPSAAAADPGPITRPIAPIARPSTAAETNASGSGSGATSPSRRSPSPKGILGSAALAAEDDEVVERPGRRGAVLTGQSWHSPRNSVIGAGAGAWPSGPVGTIGVPPPTPSFSSPRPPSAGAMWTINTGMDPAWVPPGPHYYTSPYVSHNTATPPPHSGN